MRHGLLLFAILASTWATETLLEGRIAEGQVKTVVASGHGYHVLRLDGGLGDLDLEIVGGSSGRSVGPDEQVYAQSDGPFEVRIRHARGDSTDFRLMLLDGDSLGLATTEPLRLPDSLDFGLWRLPEVEGPAIELAVEPQDLTFVVLDGALKAVAEPFSPSTLVPTRSGPRWIAVFRPAGVIGPVDFELECAPERLGIQEAFLQDLAQTEEQWSVIDTLRRHADSRAMLRYLDEYPGGYPLLPKAVPNLQIGGVERFGGYDGFHAELIINPAKREHLENPLELLDTIVHEMIHAILDLERQPGYPFADDVLDSQSDPRLRRLQGTLRKQRVKGALKEYLEREYGDGISNPAEEYIDINAAAQRIVIKVVESAMLDTGLGKQTQVFSNEGKRHSD